MKKKTLILVFMFTLIVTTALNAKEKIGLNLQFGGLYTYHQLHKIGSSYDDDGWKYRNVASTHLGGFEIGLSYEITKNWAIYISSLFSFHKIFENDTQIGFGYHFHLGKGVKLFLGGGLAVGGSVFRYGSSSNNAEHKYANVGANISLLFSYMFTHLVGLYFGVSDNFYGPVSGKLRLTVNSEKGSWRKIDPNLWPTIVTSFNARVGLKFRF